MKLHLAALAAAFTLATAGLPALAQTAVGTVITAPAPAPTEPDEMGYVGKDVAARVDLVVELLDLGAFCDPTVKATEVQYTIGGRTFKVAFTGGKLVAGSKEVDYICPLSFAPADWAAADWAEAHFTDRLHDRVFFTEGDLKTCMLPGIADGLRQTGPEFFDGFSVHNHDGDAIVKAFIDGRANLMTWRCESTDGKRRYLMIEAKFCPTGCGGADFIWLHASKSERRAAKPAAALKEEKDVCPASGPCPSPGDPVTPPAANDRLKFSCCKGG